MFRFRLQVGIELQDNFIGVTPKSNFSNWIFNADVVAVLPAPLLSEIIVRTDILYPKLYAIDLRL